MNKSKFVAEIDHVFLLLLREKVAAAGGRMRGRIGLRLGWRRSDDLETARDNLSTLELNLGLRRTTAQVASLSNGRGPRDGTG